MILFGVLFSLLFLFLNDKIIIFGVWAILFAAYVWMKTPPVEVENKITNFGVYWYGNIIVFPQINAFSVEDSNSAHLLKLYITPTGMSHLTLVLPNDTNERNRITSYLHERLPYLDNPPRSGLENIGKGLSKLFGFS